MSGDAGQNTFDTNGTSIETWILRYLKTFNTTPTTSQQTQHKALLVFNGAPALNPPSAVMIGLPDRPSKPVHMNSTPDTFLQKILRLFSFPLVSFPFPPIALSFIVLVGTESKFRFTWTGWEIIGRRMFSSSADCSVLIVISLSFSGSNVSGLLACACTFCVSYPARTLARHCRNSLILYLLRTTICLVYNIVRCDHRKERG